MLEPPDFSQEKLVISEYAEPPRSLSTQLQPADQHRSPAHIAAYENDRLVGFVNVAWDGGIHAFILDTCVTPGCEEKVSLLAWW